MALKRSDINRSIQTARQVLERIGIALPAWANWSLEQWDRVADDPAYSEVRDCMLGWDVTDFGSNDFQNIGRTLFTLRNGRGNDPRYPKGYAEKLLIDPEGQRAPAHFHRSKREDIICVAGGNVLVQLELADENGHRSGKPMTIVVDGVARSLEPGGMVRLKPGESVTIPPRTIHQFWGEEGTGIDIDGVGHTVSREVSSVCDDWNDNVFLVDYGDRFPTIAEDELRLAYLCHEYPV